MWLYARGVALAARRDFAGAAAAANAIETLERTADFKLLKDSNVPAQEVLRIARTLILARVAQAKGDYRTAIVRFERAAALQDALPYTEPPYWYYPIRQSLAAALLQAGRYAEAERQFQRALSRAPSNGWSYYGLAELHKSRGNTTAARKAEADLARTWIGDRKLLQIKESLSITRKSGYRFSLATNAKRLRGDHALECDPEKMPGNGRYQRVGTGLSPR